VLGGHINVLYPGVQARITADHRAAVQGHSRDAMRVSHTGRGFYTHASSRGSSGSSSGSLAAAIASPLVGRSCTVLSINLAESSAEVVLHDADSDSSTPAAAASSNPHQILALDALQALPQVPVNADALQPALCQAVLQSFAAWRLLPTASTAFTVAAAAAAAPAASSQTAVSLAAAVQAQCLSTRALLSSARFLITRAAQGLLLHAPTALAFIAAAGDGLGAALLELSATATVAAGLGDIAPLEERWSMLLTQWQQRTLEAREHAVRTATAKAESADAAAAAATQAAAAPDTTGATAATAAAATATATATATDSATAAAPGGSNSSGGDTAAAAAGAAVNDLAAELTALMTDMGFPARWCLRALAETGNDMEAALNWILSNGELLSAEDDEAGAEAAEAAAAVEAVAAAEAAAASSSAADGSADDSSSSTAEQAVRDAQQQQQQAVDAIELPPPPSLLQSSQAPAAATTAAGAEAAAAAALTDMWASADSSTAAAVVAAAAAAAVEAVDEGSWPRVFHYDPTSTAPLNLRAEPSTASEQVGTLFACEEITAVAQLGEWLQVQLSDYEGEYMYDEDEDSADEQVSSLSTATLYFGYYSLPRVNGMREPVKVRSSRPSNSSCR
jgi:UBA/TS-N domain